MRLVQWDVDTEWNGDFGDGERKRDEGRGETRVISDLHCQIANLFPTLVLIIKLKLLLHIDSSGCTLVLSPIKQGKRKDYMKPSGAFYGSCETVKPCHRLQSNKLPGLMCVCPGVASYVGSNAFLSCKFDYFGKHFSISCAIVNILHRLGANTCVY